MYTHDEQWQDAIDAFATAARAAGMKESTVLQRVKHVRRFAVWTERAPWQVDYEHYRAWIDGLTCQRNTVLAHRTSLRSFYRWAHGASKIAADPTDEPSFVTKRLPVPEAWDEPIRAWRSYMRAQGMPETTVQTRVSQMRRFARDRASLDPMSATLDDLAEWMASKNWSAATRRGHRSGLRMFYAWAKQTGRMSTNPAKRLASVKSQRYAARPAAELDIKLAYARADRRTQLALRLAADLGLRCAEASVVHSRDLIDRGGTLSLVVHGKGQKTRVLPLSPALATMLRAAPEGFLFPGQVNGHISSHYLGKLVSRALPTGVTMHMLRHRFATQAYNVDRDVFTVQQLLGHASPTTTQGYVQVHEDHMRRLVEAVAS